MSVIHFYYTVYTCMGFQDFASCMTEKLFKGNIFFGKALYRKLCFCFGMHSIVHVCFFVYLFLIYLYIFVHLISLGIIYCYGWFEILFRESVDTSGRLAIGYLGLFMLSQMNMYFSKLLYQQRYIDLTVELPL